MILSLRGTNGSGKSTVIRAFFDQCSSKEECHGRLGSRLPEAYRLKIPNCKAPIFVLGPYVTSCGGCDRLIPYDIILDLIQKYAARGHVIFEGVIVGSVYGRVGELLETVKKDAVVLMLDTSLEECIRRVQGRRGERDDTREFDPHNLTYKYNQTQTVIKKMQEDDIMRVIPVSDATAAETMVKLLQEAPWKKPPSRFTNLKLARPSEEGTFF